MRKFLIAVCLVFILINCKSQDKANSKFGKITPADFVVPPSLADSSVNAIVLSDIGNSEFEGNSNGNFSIVFRERKRVLLISRNAFAAATIHIPVYVGNNFTLEEKFEDFEAATYNIENGQVKTTKLEKTAVFNEKLNREATERRFTFPDLREGCIIEYQYTIRSPFYTRLRPWYFQSEYPCLWSEYKVAIPPMFSYLITHTGHIKYTVDTSTKAFKNYAIGEGGRIFNISGDATITTWAIKDIPAIKTENFTSSIKNHISKIQFLLHSIHYTGQDVRQFVKSWPQAADDLLKQENFGRDLGETNDWMGELDKLIPAGTDLLNKANKTYEYVRDNFTCSNHNSFLLSQPLRKTFESKAGTVADLNLLLTAMLIRQGFDAHPVILSTRHNGLVYEVTPLLNQYNYVISRVKIGDAYYLLDASYNRLGFGKLNQQCYNNSGRIIDKLPLLINLSADSLREEKRSTLFIVNNEKGGIEGSYSSYLGDYESYALRERMAKAKKVDLAKEIQKEMGSGIVTGDLEIDSLRLYNEPVKIAYELRFNFNGEDVIYFNPMLHEAIKKNPFVSAERFYPVEMPYTSHQVFLLDMEIPKGYIVDEIPKSVKLKLNEDEGMFEYVFSRSPGRIQMRSRIDINKANFLQDDYESLRNFFSFIIKKQSEQIVFKKIK